MRGRKGAIVLDAARELFCTRGYEAVGIEEIAAKAGVSRTTVYAVFGDKRGLFRAVIGREAGKLASLESEMRSAESGSDVRSRLAGLGLRYLQLVTRPDIVALDRALAREAHANRELVSDFLRSGPGEVRRMVVDILGRGVADGELRPDLDLAQAAEDFLALLLGPLLLADRYGGEVPESKDLQARARHVARLIVAAEAAGQG